MISQKASEISEKSLSKTVFSFWYELCVFKIKMHMKILFALLRSKSYTNVETANIYLWDLPKYLETTSNRYTVSIVNSAEISLKIYTFASSVAYISGNRNVLSRFLAMDNASNRDDYQYLMRDSSLDEF